MSARHSKIKAPQTAAAPATPEAEAGGILTVDLAAIVENWRILGRQAFPAECAAVVKAEAYGCGIEPVARALARAGCRTFFVAQLPEARRVRKAAPEATIYVLNGIVPGTASAFAEGHLRPVINSLAELAEWDSFVSASGWAGGGALHVDTGMSRLGLTPEEAAAVAPRLRGDPHGIALIMSHFIAAEEADNPRNDEQIRLFREVRVMFRGITSSLANSSGIFLGAAAHCDLVRPGAALYGVNPTPGRLNPMRPAVELKGRILQVRTLPRGATVGYGGEWTARRPSRIAVVAVGYADGYSRIAGSSDRRRGGEALVAGERCPVAGRISMDLLALDVTSLAEGAVRRGDYATLIGGDIGIDEVADNMGTIAYEVLVNLGRRCARSYKAES
jgi:alanine racemase